MGQHKRSDILVGKVAHLWLLSLRGKRLEGGRLIVGFQPRHLIVNTSQRRVQSGSCLRIVPSLDKQIAVSVTIAAVPPLDLSRNVILRCVMP